MSTERNLQNDCFKDTNDPYYYHKPYGIGWNMKLTGSNKAKSYDEQYL
jgi:hypothetical protein